VTFDPVGGPFLEKLADAAQPGGIIFAYGALSGQPTPFPLLTALPKDLSVRGYTLMEITRVPEKLAVAKKYVYDRLADGSFRPKIAKTFRLHRQSMRTDTSNRTHRLGKLSSRYRRANNYKSPHAAALVPQKKYAYMASVV
jgi:NADPH:quinone reductase-like Zn-dependent oxidoreductase